MVQKLPVSVFHKVTKNQTFQVLGPALAVLSSKCHFRNATIEEKQKEQVVHALLHRIPVFNFGVYLFCCQ